MINTKFYGCGAAGNKVAIKLIEDTVLAKEDIVLVNSTLKDIPDGYQESAMIFSTDINSGGCGKERTIGKTRLINCLKEGKFNIDDTVRSTDQIAIVCGSTEGGSGSSSIPIIAKYLTEVTGIHVIVLLIFGFEDDVRGLQNSIEICQELSDNYGIIAISNAKYSQKYKNNKVKCEKAANEEIETYVRILKGMSIRESTQNIDDTDLYKLSATPGYMVMGRVNFSANLKSESHYANTISEFISECKYIDGMDPSCKRIGAIFNIKDKTTDYIDLSSSILKDEYGQPYEYFYHIQNPNDGEEWMDYIVCGMKMPIEHLSTIYNEYLDNTSKVSKSKDNFFDQLGEMKGNKEDSMFDVFSDKKNTKTKDTAKSDFFNTLGIIETGASKNEAKSKKDKDPSSVAEY